MWRVPNPKNSFKMSWKHNFSTVEEALAFVIPAFKTTHRLGCLFSIFGVAYMVSPTQTKDRYSLFSNGNPSGSLNLEGLHTWEDIAHLLPGHVAEQLDIRLYRFPQVQEAFYSHDWDVVQDLRQYRCRRCVMRLPRSYYKYAEEGESEDDLMVNHLYRCGTVPMSCNEHQAHRIHQW